MQGAERPDGSVADLNELLGPEATPATRAYRDGVVLPPRLAGARGGRSARNRVTHAAGPAHARPAAPGLITRRRGGDRSMTARWERQLHRLREAPVPLQRVHER